MKATRVAATCLVLWVLLGGTPMWLILAALLWEFGGDASVLGAMWVIDRTREDERDHGP